MRPTRLIGVLLAIVLIGAAPGCERVSERDGGAARQLVTTEFGTRVLVDEAARDGASVLDALRAAAPVETAFGGGFVRGIGDVRSDAGGRRDWFYYVNGVSAGRGADQQKLRPGDVVWWDFRPWGGLLDAWAVVGSWPEPFVHGYPSAPAAVEADAPLDDALIAAGASVAGGPSHWRVRIGADADLRARDGAWRRAMADPEAAGLTVRFADGGIDALDADGSSWRTVTGGRALAAAVLTRPTPDDGGVLMVVAGVDDEAARAAAARIARDPEVLRARYAVVFDAAGAPVAAGGRPS